MSDVQSVTVELRGPSGERLGSVTEGYFVVDGDKLQMTLPSGEPICDSEGEPVKEFQVTLKPGEYPPAIACVLTHKVRRYLRGETEEMSAFNRPLGYSNMGIA